MRHAATGPCYQMDGSGGLFACHGQRNRPPGRSKLHEMAGSSSPVPPGRTIAATRRYAPTCTKGCRWTRQPPGPATRRPRCARRYVTFGPARRGSSLTPDPAPPGHRPRTPPGNASSNCAGPGTRPRRSPRRWPAPPLRSTAPGSQKYWPRQAFPAYRYAHPPNVAPHTATIPAELRSSTSPNCPTKPRQRWPGCCWRCPNWSPSICQR